MEHQEDLLAFFTGPILVPIFITTIMTIISKPLNLGVLGALLRFGDVPEFLSQLLTQKNLVHAFAGALVSEANCVNFICTLQYFSLDVLFGRVLVRQCILTKTDVN